MANYDKMSIDDLWNLHEQICSVLEKRIAEEKRKLEHRLDELNRGLSVTQAALPQKRRPYPKVEPKYRNPENPSITWSGRGKQPVWVSEFLAAGGSIDTIRISEIAVENTSHLAKRNRSKKSKPRAGT
jgi:DNA-binding protein H-NS